MKSDIDMTKHKRNNKLTKPVPFRKASTIPPMNAAQLTPTNESRPSYTGNMLHHIFTIWISVYTTIHSGHLDAW